MTTTPSLATVARRQAHVQRLAQENAELRRQVEALRRKADAENPAQPVPEPGEEGAAASTEETRAADTTIDVTQPGGVMDAPSADASAEVTTPGGVIPAEAAPTQNVEAPVSGGTDVPVADVRTEVDVNTEGETIGEIAFTEGEWATTAAKIRQRVWASLRLAKMRRQAGIASGDEIDLAMQIEASRMTNGEIRTEIETLTRVASTRPQRQAPAPQRTAARTPSLAGGTPSLPASIASGMSPTADEFAFEV